MTNQNHAPLPQPEDITPVTPPQEQLSRRVQVGKKIAAGVAFLGLAAGGFAAMRGFEGGEAEHRQPGHSTTYSPDVPNGGGGGETEAPRTPEDNGGPDFTKGELFPLDNPKKIADIVENKDLNKGVVDFLGTNYTKRSITGDAGMNNEVPIVRYDIGSGGGLVVSLESADSSTSISFDTVSESGEALTGPFYNKQGEEVDRNSPDLYSAVSFSNQGGIQQWNMWTGISAKNDDSKRFMRIFAMGIPKLSNANPDEALRSFNGLGTDFTDAGLR